MSGNFWQALKRISQKSTPQGSYAASVQNSNHKTYKKPIKRLKRDENSLDAKKRDVT
jgi:hypothetical protein